MQQSLKNNLYLLSVVALLILLPLMLGLPKVISLILLIFFIYAKIATQRPKGKEINLLNLIFLLSLMTAITKFIVTNTISLYWIPIAILGMLMTILFNDLELTFIFVCVNCVICGIIANYNLSFTIYLLISGLGAGCLVIKVHKRSDIIRAGVLTSLIQLTTVFFLDNLRIYPEQLSKYTVTSLTGILSAFFVLGTLPIFEYLFNRITNITLLELSDFNHPLLKKMTLEAPGTYHHSLIVGNLSEMAAEAIGANSFLARIGAYYHDIGKIDKPGYFTENQKAESKHDNLTANISKSVIMNHVKEGVDIAKKYKLNKRIIDFIEQHHGTGLVYYFYVRALEGMEEGNEKIEESGFRYPGPKPVTKETAIVLLADSVEAASRSLFDSGPAKIEDLVRKIINNKFIDGQLDECDLTLKDIDKIANVFSHVLSGIYHARIKYPQ